MTREEAIAKFEKQLTSAMVVLDSGFGTRPGESDRVYRERKEMAEIALSALRAQQELESKLRVLESNEPLKEFAEDVARQFAYRVKTIDGHAAYSSGGLSTLETAFDILEWDEPHPCPECECEATGCHEWATCGTPTKDGYKLLCGKHFRAVQEEG